MSFQDKDRQQEIAGHILTALALRGMSGGEIIEHCRPKFAPSEVGPVLTGMVRIGSVRIEDSTYFHIPHAQLPRIPLSLKLL